MKKSFWIILCFLFLSCATTNGVKSREYNERLKAENSLMKKRLALLERENDVLKTENLQYKKNLQQLEAQVEKLRADLASLTEKYTKDIALHEAGRRNLEEKNAILEKESTEKIQELTRLNRELEKKLGDELKRLNEQMALQAAGFNKEREAFKTESARREFE
ncbi:MAG TPA: hypothetical protein ENN21_07960, partial [Spirochaetes bacterium]|nr:hypothetical protein [Spirochaetota bacterium]